MTLRTAVWWLPGSPLWDEALAEAARDDDAEVTA